jgi:hypothetical protein
VVTTHLMGDEVLLEPIYASLFLETTGLRDRIRAGTYVKPWSRGDTLSNRQSLKSSSEVAPGRFLFGSKAMFAK